jgi:hypothetical protein
MGGSSFGTLRYRVFSILKAQIIYEHIETNYLACCCHLSSHTELAMSLTHKYHANSGSDPKPLSSCVLNQT